MRIIFFIVFTFLAAQYLPAAMGGSFAIASKNLNEIDNTSFYLEKFSFTSDVPFSQEEFEYLADLEPQTFVSKSDVQKAYRNIMRTKRFNNIDIDLTDGKQGKILLFKLEGQWLLSNVKVSGFLFGKYEYGALYLQQPGDVFDINLHEESLQIMQKHLEDHGYFDGIIEDELVYNPDKKSILVKLNFDRGQRYKINSISLKQKTKGDNPLLVENILDETKVTFKNFLIKYFYTRDYIKKITHAIKDKLIEADFDQPRILMKKIFDRDAKKMDIILTIDCNSRRVVRLKGNVSLSDSFILNKFIPKDQPHWLFSPEIICEQLMHEYERRGFSKTIVEYTIDHDVYTFVIREGVPALLEAIEIKHAESLKSEDMNYFWQELLDKQFFDQDLFDQKVLEFKALYEKNGYWDFAIVDQQTVVNNLTGKRIITLFINKGIQRLWGGFEIKDYPEGLDLPNFKKFHLRSKNQLIPFNRAWLSEQKSLLVNALQQESYWHADAQYSLQEVPLDGDEKERAVQKIFVSWQIQPGAQIAFGKTIVRGSTKLPFERIKNEIKFQEGDVWSKEKIDLTRKKLKRLDIFKRVQVQPHQGNTKFKKPVIVTLADDDPFEVRLRAGAYVPSNSALFKEEVTIKVGTTAVAKNPTNRADKIAFDAVLSNFEQNFNLEYQQPFLFNLPVLGKVKLYANEFVHPLHIASGPSAYQSDAIGGMVALNEEYKDSYFLGLNAGNEWIKTSNVAGNINFDPSLLNKYVRYVFLEPNFAIDHLNDKINTTQGNITLLSCKLMLPSQISDYLARCRFEHASFYPIHEDIILAGRVCFGHIFKRKFDTIMPIERFFLGGPNSVRGYEKDSVPPLGETIKVNINAGVAESKTEYTIQGGSSMLNLNLEVRFPVWRKLVQGVVFQDLGALSQSDLYGLSEHWYPATGFGLRVKTPVGPIRFDYGWKWKKRFASDSNHAWYLTLGEAF